MFDVLPIETHVKKMRPHPHQPQERYFEQN